MHYVTSMSITKGLSTLQIQSLLQNNKFFCGVFACDNIPQFVHRPCAIIVNTDGAAEAGEHWVTIILKLGHKALYFDPFGFPPLIPEIQEYLTTHASNGFKYNSLTLQHPNSQACGYYCIAFVHFWAKRWTLAMFCSYFSGRMGRDLVANDRKLFALFET